MDDWLQCRGVVLIGGGLDESPMAYRRLPDVSARHGSSIRVVHAAAVRGRYGGRRRIRPVQGLSMTESTELSMSISSPECLLWQALSR